MVLTLNFNSANLIKMEKPKAKTLKSHAETPETLIGTLANTVSDKMAETFSQQSLDDAAKVSSEVAKKLAEDTVTFVRKNPWVALFGAAAIGYILGSSRGSKR